jgi:hypothetical protein
LGQTSLTSGHSRRRTVDASLLDPDAEILRKSLLSRRRARRATIRRLLNLDSQILMLDEKEPAAELSEVRLRSMASSRPRDAIVSSGSPQELADVIAYLTAERVVAE